MPALIQSSFAKGEVAPGIYGRVDLAAYYVALRTAYNCIIHRFGGVSNRAGTEYIGPVKTHGDTAPLLIPFQQKTTDTYMLEFGDEYMRVLRNDAHVLEAALNIRAVTQASPGVFTAISHGYSDGDELFLSAIQGMVQLNGRRFVVTNAAASSFRLVDQLTGVAVDTTNYDAFAFLHRVANPEFSADTDWTKGDGWTIAAGVADCDGTQAAESELSQTAIIELEEGVSYYVSYRYSLAAGTLKVNIGGTDGVTHNGVTGLTTPATQYITAGATQTIAFVADADFVGTIDLIYVQAASENQVAKVFELATPYSGDDITGTNVLKFIQDADVMTLTHNLYPVHELTRTGHTSWTLAEASFGPSIDDPTALAVSPNTTAAVTYQYKVTALKRDTLEESLPAVNNTSKSITSATAADPAVFTSNAHTYLDGYELEITAVAGAGAWATGLNGKRFTVANKATNTYQLLDGNGDLVDSSAWGAYPGSGVTRATLAYITNGHGTANNTITWAAVTDAERYNVYKYDNGSYGLIGTTEALTFTDDAITADLSKSHPRARNPFDEAGDYPNCAGYFAQRRIFAGTLNDPDVHWDSQTGLPNNLNISSPLQDDDAITTRLNSQDVQEIRWIMADDDLLLFTSSAEWRSRTGDQRYSIDTINQKPQTDWGSAFHLQPVKAGDTTLFVEDGGKRVRAFGYSFQQDKYRGPEISLLWAHMLKRYGIVSWAYQRKPEPRIYMVREDGMLLTLTFDSDQEVNAATRWATNGKFKRVAVLRNPSTTIGSEDGVYFVVERTVDGTSRKYIEKLSSRIFDDVRDCRFVDCGVSYDNPITITGIDTNGPISVDAAAHGLDDGTEIEFADILWVPDEDDVGTETQPDQLNYTRYYVANATTDAFDIVDENDTPVDGLSFNAYASGGTVRACAGSFLGYEHLEGESLVGLVDGNVFRDLVVLGGRIDLPDGITAARAHFGLPYKAEAETLDIEAPDSTILSRNRSIDVVGLLFEQTRGLWVGPDAARLLPLKMREFEEMGDPIELLTGTKIVDLMNGWDTKGRILMRQLDPVPFTLLAAIPNMEVGG